jgi:transcriptional regulator with XRE-family HTH domain/Zn-dependent peptidase ImmA (M78 family)
MQTVDVMTSTDIGTRLKQLRLERGLSQNDLARLWGFNDRQTVSAIEKGIRRVSADELLNVTNRLGVPLSYFLDRFALASPPTFSWRLGQVQSKDLEEFQSKAERWLIAFRDVASSIGRARPLLRRQLALNRDNRFEDAMAAGERFVAEFALGEVPAIRLADLMERELGILVLYADAPDGISGAACRFSDSDAVLINRQENAGRRNFNLAHELFHVLTWDAMPPRRQEAPIEIGGNRTEQLANSFASAVLMPASALETFVLTPNLTVEELADELNSTADALQVTATALKWRLVALRKLRPSLAKRIPDRLLRNNGGRPHDPAQPPLFSRVFLEVFGAALQEKRVTTTEFRELVGQTGVDEIGLFENHGLINPL